MFLYYLSVVAFAVDNTPDVDQSDEHAGHRGPEYPPHVQYHLQMNGIMNTHTNLLCVNEGPELRTAKTAQVSTPLTRISILLKRWKKKIIFAHMHTRTHSENRN